MKKPTWRVGTVLSPYQPSSLYWLLPSELGGSLDVLRFLPGDYSLQALTVSSPPWGGPLSLTRGWAWPCPHSQAGLRCPQACTSGCTHPQRRQAG